MIARGFIAFVAAWALLGCTIGEGEYFGKVGKPRPGHLRWCNSGEPEYLDPALVTSTTGTPIVEVLFDGIANHGPDAMPVPGLATSWDISADLRRFTFHLREDAKWSNGRPIVADDFAYHIVRIIHPQTASRNAEGHWNIKNGKLFTANRVKLVTRDVPPFDKGDVVEVLGWHGVATEGAELFEGSSSWPAPTRLDVRAAKDSGEPSLEVPEGTSVAVLEVSGADARITWSTSADETLQGWTSAAVLQVPLPDTNKRKSSAVLALRDFGEPVTKAYASVPAGEEVIVIETRGEMSYVFHPAGDGLYGWVPTDELDIQPNASIRYQLREVPPEHRPGVTFGADPHLALREGEATGRDLLMTPEVLGVRTPDPHTLVVETWGPVPYMVNVIASRFFRPTPREAVSRHPKRWTYPEHIVTSGPYTLTSWRDRDSIELVKSPNYWNPELPKLERVTIYSINDQGASANYYYQGGCDAVSSNNIPASYLPAINGERRPGGKAFKDYIAAPYLGIYFYVFNTEVMDNVHLRRALSHAIDRRPIPKILHGGQIPTNQYVPGTPIEQLSPEERQLCGVKEGDPGVAMIVEAGKLCYVPPIGPTFDLEKARSELELAKKEMGSRFPKKISLKFNSGVEQHKLIAEYIQHEWKQRLGLDIELHVQEWKTFLKATKAGEFQVARMGWIGGYLDPEQNFMKNFKCNNPQNRSRWCNEEFDALFKEIEAEANRGKRLELLKRAEALMIEASPVMPLYVYTQHHLQKPYVKGLKVNLTDRVLFQHVYFDEDWRRGAE